MADSYAFPQEPLEFQAGDSLCFSKYWPCFLPSAGWTSYYEIRSAKQPGFPAITINGVADATNSYFTYSATAAQTAPWQQGEAVLVGFVVNAGTQARHNIYENYLRLTPNLGTGSNQVDLTTHAQRMIPILEQQLEQLAAHTIDESDIQQVRIKREKRMDLEKQLAWNKTLHMNEIAQKNANNNRPSGNKIVPMFNIIPYGGPGVGIQNPFIPNT